MLTGTEVSKRIGVARSTLYLWVQSGMFPEAVRIKGRRHGWKEEVVSQWIAENVK